MEVCAIHSCYFSRYHCGDAIACRLKINIRSMNESTIIIKSAHEIILVDFNDIEYIESVENYIRIHFTNGKSIMSLMPLKMILENLPPEKFVRIHRRFIVSIDKIKSVGTKKVRWNSVELPGGSYLKDLKKLIAVFCFLISGICYSQDSTGIKQEVFFSFGIYHLVTNDGSLYDNVVHGSLEFIEQQKPIEFNKAFLRRKPIANITAKCKK